LESTCDSSSNTAFIKEIVEISSLLIPYDSTTTLSTFHTFVKPKLHPKLSQYCLKATGIRQDQVDVAPTFEEAMNSHTQWLTQHLQQAPTSDNVLVVTSSDWDLGTLA
jgi:inhibitor of KinA sporulation pathway (predicted exonuclease)